MKHSRSQKLMASTEEKISCTEMNIACFLMRGCFQNKQSGQVCTLTTSTAMSYMVLHKIENSFLESVIAKRKGGGDTDKGLTAL